MARFPSFQILRLACAVILALAAGACTNSDRLGLVPGLTGDAGSGVNKYLWRASLQTLAFMSPAGDGGEGIIVTDWTTMKGAPNERFKVRAFIEGDTLSADNVRIDLFRQRLEGNKWADAQPQKSTARQLVTVIVARAQQLRDEDRKPAAP